MKSITVTVLFVTFALLLGCKADPCETTTCQNGGIPAKQNGACLCDCAGTGYQGENCETKTLKPGVEHEGGIIFYIDTTGVHGLIAAKEDASISAPWGCTGTSIAGAVSSGIGAGAGNTTAIVDACSTAGTAAKICYDYSGNDKSDWYLPAEAELLQLYSQKAKVGGFKTVFYWSSTQGNASHARFFNIETGEVATDDKGYGFGVRAIRSF